jgi:hypothetical protein
MTSSQYNPPAKCPQSTQSSSVLTWPGPSSWQRCHHHPPPHTPRPEPPLFSGHLPPLLVPPPPPACDLLPQLKPGSAPRPHPTVCQALGLPCPPLSSQACSEAPHLPSFPSFTVHCQSSRHGPSPAARPRAPGWRYPAHNRPPLLRYHPAVPRAPQTRAPGRPLSVQPGRRLPKPGLPCRPL